MFCFPSIVRIFVNLGAGYLLNRKQCVEEGWLDFWMNDFKCLDSFFVVITPCRSFAHLIPQLDPELSRR